MKKTVKSALISVLGASLALSAIPVNAFALQEEYAATVSVRIEGISECLYSGEVSYASLPDKLTAAQVFKTADADSDDISITWTSSDYGDYISAVNDDKEASFGGWDGWMFSVNGVTSDVGVSSKTVEDGDVIVLFYADPYGAGMQYPLLAVNPTAGTITATSDDAVYDANYNVTYVRNPVVGMTINLSGSQTYTFVTDENGVIDLAEAEVPEGEYTISYEKVSSTGVPLVLRGPADLTIDLEYRYTFGEVNSDSVVDAIDASLVLGEYARKATNQESQFDYFAKLAADVNKDNVIDAVDASEILSYYAYTATGGTDSPKDYFNK